MKVLALPRDPNPYQELLYQAIRRNGVHVSYGAELTGSRTLNLLLLPAELAAARLTGYRVLHIHWVFCFVFPGARRLPVILRLSRLWFVLLLKWAHLLGLRLVWTAHNVLPHDQVFDDDLQARRTLVRCADLVIAHTSYALEGLDQIGAHPRLSRVMPLGPMVGPDRFRDLPAPGSRADRTCLFFGRVAPYKGLEDLLSVFTDAPGGLRLIVAGACFNAELRHQLEHLARLAGPVVRLRLDEVPDAELSSLFGQADALVFPFRAVTTSSSVLLGMATGRPVLIPDLPAFRELPEAAVIRYPPGIEGLRAALEQLAVRSAESLIATGETGRRHALAPSWDELADHTAQSFRSLLAR